MLPRHHNVPNVCNLLWVGLAIYIELGKEHVVYFMLAPLDFLVAARGFVMDACDWSEGIQWHCLRLNTELVKELPLRCPAHPDVISFLELFWSVKRMAAACVGPD